MDALQLSAYVASRRDHLVSLLADLVRTPSENRAPRGAELACQQLLANRLARIGCPPHLYEPDSVPALLTHPLYWPGRDYRQRPNLVATLPGAGGGRSLLLSGHIDTVPAGSLPWSRPPFGATVEGIRLYGRGAWDMKAGVAANLFVLEAIHELGIRLRGDLLFESVVDEEFGGVNGTLAGRVAGYRADAAIVGEPSGRYLWILTRSQRLSPRQYAALVARVQALGYDTALLRRTQH